MCEDAIQILTMLGNWSDARINGISVWDCLLKEDVLVVPWVLAFLGDNPMASEFASHIGMTGSCYCRICQAHNSTADPRVRLDTFLKVGSMSV